MACLWSSKNNLTETFSNFFTLNTQLHKHNTRKNRLILPKVKTISYGSNSKTIKQWNEIQDFIKIYIYSTKMTYSKFLKSVENYMYVYIYFSTWVFFYEHSWITGLQGKGEGIPLTPHYHFDPLHTHLDISRAITAESSPLHIASSWTQTGNFWFLSASR